MKPGRTRPEGTVAVRLVSVVAPSGPVMLTSKLAYAPEMVSWDARASKTSTSPLTFDVRVIFADVRVPRLELNIGKERVSENAGVEGPQAEEKDSDWAKASAGVNKLPKIKKGTKVFTTG